MKQLIPPIVIAVVLVTVGTLLQGRYTERWRRMDSTELQTFTSHVDRVPREIGDWIGTDDEPLSEQEWNATNCTNYVSRTYRHRETGKAVSFYLVSGTARHITIHTPDWCYAGAGFTQHGKIENHSVPMDQGGAPAQFATAVFANYKPAMAKRP